MPVDVPLYKPLNLAEDIPIQSATTQSSEGKLSFEETVLKELSNLKKSQQSFEARIETRIETIFNDQSQIRGNGRKEGNGESRLMSNTQRRMESNGHQSQMQLGRGSRQFGGTEIQSRHREQVSYKHRIEDFEEFEEFDENFPVTTKPDLESLEYNIRKNLNFKFLLVI